MTMIVNKQPDPPPAPAPPGILDRPGLEQADRSLRAVRFFMRLALALVIGIAIIAVKVTHGVSLFAIPSAFLSWLLIEVAIIAARACVAGAWAVRTPEPPAPPA